MQAYTMHAAGLAAGAGSGKHVARLILASSSPRRVELLRSLGLGFSILPSNIDEDFAEGDKPADIVLKLALAKARAVVDLIGETDESKLTQVSGAITCGAALSGAPTLVLGADTIVVIDDDVLGKPSSPEEACRMLAGMSGRMHQVFTGIALLSLPDDRAETGYEVSNVYFKPMQEREIAAYVATGEPADKAGAYALQGTGSAFVERIDGCFTNIIGLPVPKLVTLLRRFGITVLGLP